MKLYILILSSLLYLISCAPGKNAAGRDLHKKDNHSILKRQMSDSLYQATEGRHVKRRNRIIKTKREAYKLAKAAFLEYEDKEFLEGR